MTADNNSPVPGINFPVRLFREGDPLPTEATAFLVGSNGAFVHRRTFAFEGTVPTRQPLPQLAAVPLSGRYLLPPIPAERTLMMLKFFRSIWEQMKTESILLLSYHEQRGTFRLEAPPQRVSAGSIHHEVPRAAPGFVYVGSAHSHGSMSAFHSGTDIADEAHFDGIHFTFGRLDKQLIEIVVSLVINGERFPLKVEEVLAGAVHTKIVHEPPPVIVPPPPPVIINPSQPMLALSGSPREMFIALVSRGDSALTSFFYENRHLPSLATFTGLDHFLRICADFRRQVEAEHLATHKAPSRRRKRRQTPTPLPASIEPFAHPSHSVHPHYGSRIHPPPGQQSTYSWTESGYQVTVPEGTPLEETQPPESWYAKVTRLTMEYSYRPPAGTYQRPMIGPRASQPETTGSATFSFNPLEDPMDLDKSVGSGVRQADASPKQPQPTRCWTVDDADWELDLDNT